MKALDYVYFPLLAININLWLAIVIGCLLGIRPLHPLCGEKVRSLWRSSWSSEVHNTSDLVVYVINIRSGHNNNKIIPRCEHRICSRTEIITQNSSRDTRTYHLTLCKHGEVLAIAACNVKTLMDVVSQAVTVHTLSWYRVDVW